MSIPEEFSRFPDHWDVLPFTKAVKDATSGNIKIQTSDYLEDGLIPIVDQGQLHYGGFTDDKLTICKSELPTIVFGDHTRVFKYIEEPFALGADGAKVLEPLANLDKRFLFHYLKQLKIESAGYSRHYKFLKETYVPVPPLAEQKRITAILDKADAIRQKRQQTITLADDFLRSVFLDMFGDPVTNPKGWEMQPISKVAEVQGGLQVTKKREGLPVTCPYLRVANVYRGHLELSEVKTMQVTDAELERVSLVKDDILVVEGHGNKEEIGRCAMWDGSIENIIHQNHLIRVRVTKNRVLPQYLTDFINSEGGRTQLIGASNTTSGLNTISTRLVKETEVLIPDLQTQERYVHIFNKVKEALRCFQKGALGCTELFETVSQKAFSGQL